jgi:hypothetical protein
MRIDVLTPRRLRDHGLLLAGVVSSPKHTDERRHRDFQKQYGAPAVALADMWFDLQTTTIPGAALSESENSSKGLDRFLIAQNWLWIYHRNAKILADKFRICEDYAKGEKLWSWVRKIAALKDEKIVWNPQKLNHPHGPVFICSVDGTDYRTWEQKHPTLPQDRKQMSHKFKHGALKYEIAVCNYYSQICWVSGPHAGGKHDLTIFREGLKQKIVDGKRVNVDRGYRSSRADERMLSIPNACDSKLLCNFKSRSRLRGETFNGRLKKYEILNQTFRHGREKHSFAFLAVVVTMQYRMDNGEPLFEV